MNQANYCTREAAQRLVDAGIVMETDMMWVTDGVDSQLMNSITRFRKGMKVSCLPAPCFTDVWRELPKHYTYFINNWASIFSIQMCVSGKFSNENPTDAAIDLLIWVVGQKKGEPS